MDKKIGKTREAVEGVIEGRRKFLKSAAIAVGGSTAVLAASGQVGAPFVATAKGADTTWKIQTSWPGGIGLEIFKDWANGIADKTGGELDLVARGIGLELSSPSARRTWWAISNSSTR